MRRRIFHIVGILSLMLWLAVVGMWVCSYWRSDLWGYEQAVVRGRSRWGGNVSSAAGTLSIEWWNRPDIGEPTTAQGSFGHFASAVDAGSAAARLAYVKTLGGF